MQTNTFDYITTEDIIRSARRLRDTDNARLHVRPWNHGTRLAWYVALLAACLISFILGYSFRLAVSTPSVPDNSPSKAASSVVAHTHLSSPPSPSPAFSSSFTTSPDTLGVCMLNDGIRYDLLISRQP